MEHEIELQIDPEFFDEVDGASIVAAIDATLRHQQTGLANMSVVITDNREIQRLNNAYRGVNAPTDVLSFSNLERRPDALIELAIPPELAAELGQYLGDIIIAFPYAAKQAADYGNSIDSELRLLAVHGTLHLLGYDHADPEQEAQMWAIQDEVLAHFGDQALSGRVYTS
ncbi:MAG: rRNA maturation RNase YbeY [Caldilineaceae bacterium]|nr:rRNA maturation RNase YbeY [Caldilineaceae bacterium]